MFPGDFIGPMGLPEFLFGLFESRPPAPRNGTAPLQSGIGPFIDLILANAEVLAIEIKAVYHSINIVISLFVLGGLSKSLYSGYLRRLFEAVRSVESLSERLEETTEQQRRLVDAVVAIGYATEGEHQINADRLQAELVDEDGPGRFLAGEPDLELLGEGEPIETTEP